MPQASDPPPPTAAAARTAAAGPTGRPAPIDRTDLPAAAPPDVPGRASPAQDWRILVAVFWVTSMVEGLGISQVFALLPAYLREMGVPPAERLTFIGTFSALVFVVGMPLVPLWGAWADKYSRKVVIVRSAIVESVVFVGVALAREPWQVGLSMLLIGLQLGNTGVMLGGIRDVTPRVRLGGTIAVFGASGPIGFAVGPVLAGVLIDGLGWSLSQVFAFSAALSLGTALLVTFGSREVRPAVVPTGRVRDIAMASLRGVLTDPPTRRIFVIFGISFVATQMCRPYIPVLVEGVNGIGPGLASAIALVVGTAALVGALVAPLGGLLGDRIGFRPVLIAALGGAGIALLLMPFVASVGGLAVLGVVLGAATATVSSMVFGLLATELPPDRRSAALNLVYLPLYAAGIVGPAAGAVLASLGGVDVLFVAGAAVFWLGAVMVHRRRAPAVSESVGPVVNPSETGVASEL
jgi:DHA1 family multidrug resistance protein-like MFS transporter